MEVIVPIIMISLRRSTDSGGGIGYVSSFVIFKETNAPAWKSYSLWSNLFFFIHKLGYYWSSCSFLFFFFFLVIPVYNYLTCFNKPDFAIMFKCNKKGLSSMEIDVATKKNEIKFCSDS